MSDQLVQNQQKDASADEANSPMTANQPASAKSEQRTKPSPGAILAAIALIAISVGLLSLTAHSLSTDRDFISYWAGAKLLATHGNPYDAASVLKLENSVGNSFTRPLVLRNTPITLFLMAPLGWFSVWTAAILWEIASIAAALLSLRLLQPFAPGKIPLILYFFAPVADCVLAGQTTLLVLLGVCLFIRFQKDRPFVAGLALVLTLLKPHLLLLFWPVFLLEILRRRNFRVLWGSIAGVAGATAVAIALDVHIWSQYLASVRAEHIENQYFPNISVGLRVLIAPQSLWPQLLPAAVGVVLGLWFWWRTRDRWQWHREGAMLIAASALVSPYSFLVDQVLFLPAVLDCYPRGSQIEQWIFIAINAAAFFLMLKIPAMSSPVTIWVAPAMMLWCWFIFRRSLPTAH
ncbi:MAG TPA: glycosyltransferase family 87 protein [Acidobacteriaceae bacterium]|nr:glycosyltransferase family 87 protein [Acidobacteriaceae bacterium]